MPTAGDRKINRRFLATVKKCKASGMDRETCITKIKDSVAAARDRDGWRDSEYVMAIAEWSLAINKVYPEA